jgi:hypothetical protein
MFDEPKFSLGILDEYERSWIMAFLRGTPWEELFESLDDASAPPSWLVEWSAHLRADHIFTIDEIDPLWSEAFLVTDSSNGECWFIIEECGEAFAAFARISAADGMPSHEAVATAVLKYMRTIGDYPVIGRLQINPVWIPPPVMKEIMEACKK